MVVVVAVAFWCIFLLGDMNLKVPGAGLLPWMFLGGGRGDIGVLSLWSGSALLAGLRTGFGAVALGNARQ